MAGLFAKGTTLWVGTSGSPSSFGKVGKVKSITGPGFSVTTIDTTTHDTVGNYKEFAAVLCEAGDVSFTVNYDPSDATLAPATGLFNDMQNLTERGFQVRFPVSDTLHSRMNFTGFVTGHPFTFPVDNVIEATITIKVDGMVTWDTVPG